MAGPQNWCRESAQELGLGCSEAPLDDAPWGPAARRSESDQVSTPARSSLLPEEGQRWTLYMSAAADWTFIRS